MPENQPLVLGMGCLHADHRWPLAIEAWRRVAPSWPHARLWLIGDGPQREELYRRIRDADLYGRVLLPGEFDATEDLLQAADLLISPMSAPKESLAVLEAMGAGVPVVACEGTYPELLIDGVTGFVVKPRDAGGLATTIARALHHPLQARCVRGGRSDAHAGNARSDHHGHSPPETVSATRLVPSEVGEMTHRILQIIPSLDRGGAEKQLALLATRLPRDQFDVHVCTLTRGGPLSSELRRATGPAARDRQTLEGGSGGLLAVAKVDSSTPPTARANLALRRQQLRAASRVADRRSASGRQRTVCRPLEGLARTGHRSTPGTAHRPHRDE